LGIIGWRSGGGVDPDDEQGGGAVNVDVRCGLTRKARRDWLQLIQSKPLPQGARSYRPTPAVQF
jgi:hypothetical protein